MYFDLLLFLIGLVFGLVAFSQIAYPVVSLVPKVRALLRVNRHEKALLVTFLLLAPAVWTVILASTILLARRYLPLQCRAYLIGLTVVLLVVLLNLHGKNQEIENDFLNRVKTCLRLSHPDTPVRKGNREKPRCGK